MILISNLLNKLGKGTYTSQSIGFGIYIKGFLNKSEYCKRSGVEQTINFELINPM